MKMPETKVVVFNAAAVLISVGALVGLVRGLLVSPTAAPCSERYNNSTVFALQRGGVMLTAADLQSSLGGEDAGVLGNLTIAGIKDAPAPVVMTVRLPKGSTSPDASTSPQGGVSFPWQPRPVQGKTAACLSYSVLLPKDFQFHRGGTLPGLSGAEDGAPSQEAFVARIAWREGGLGGATLRVTSDGATRGAPVDRESFPFPRGRWVKLEQEVVLNTPKQADGVLRLWVDGQLVTERGDLAYRTKPGVALSGVAAEVFYGVGEGGGASPADTGISLTPFDIRW